MKNKSPLVSIGMPVYNGGRFLSEALDSLLNQDFQNFELIISDNASTDNTAEICKRYLEKGSSIKYYRNEVNIGAVANFNKVMKYASAPYFMWAAYDDLWEFSYISELVKIMESDKSIVLAFSDFDAIDENCRQIERYPKILKLSSSEPSETIFKRAYRFILFKEEDGKANLIYGLVRSPILKEIGGIVNFGRGDYAIDDLTLFRILFRGNFYITNKLLFHKRIVSTVDKPLNEYTIRECFIKTPRFIHNICEFLIEIHGYFFGYRRIIGISRLPLYQKIILHFLTIPRELKWHVKIVFVSLKGFIYHAARIMLYKLTKLIAD
jgi:glycosyltransferase involved in cell wall biosynthesis